jgi:hypothetical protein
LIYALSGGAAALAISSATLRRDYWEFLGSLRASLETEGGRGTDG